MLKRAESIADIHLACDTRPLKLDELDEFFVPTQEARDPNLDSRRQLQKVLERDRRGFHKLLLAGHAGTGKSTELVKLVSDLGRDFFVVRFSVAQECNLVHVAVEDLLVVMMERLVAASDQADLDTDTVNQTALKSIYDWFAHHTEWAETDIEAGLDAEAGADVSASYLGRLLGLLGKIKTTIKRSDIRGNKSVLVKARRLSELTDRCNLLLKEVQRVLDHNQKTLLVIIEDLDKVNLEDARRIFIEQPAVLAELDSNLICTIPIFLLHSPDRAVLEQYFKDFVLPMPKVRDLEDNPYQVGRQAIRDVIERRMDMQLIEDNALELLIDKTGGVLRDVFKVLITAAETADSLVERGKQERPVINRDNVRYSLNRLRTDYKRSLSVIHLPSSWNVDLSDLYARLRELGRKPQKVLESDHCGMVLLQSRAVLEYNGEQWFALHPLVAEFVDDLP